ncbi:FliH/SctL family protein [Nocardioides caeni]|uniref:Uncharacterized protein n=1 Tax=Nocardioides caeni TaxID=574700 RepID=A0A4S8NEK4_9ACTN|nr:FliH/SctL family protein [Nocardioides caeni]THV14705.1 hypothetical protein E9934_08615 [Nocardioides caeni]
MSSSSDARGATTVTVPALPELRVGTWTRRGGDTLLGDEVTESLLAGVAAETRDAARAQGYAVGWAEGRRAAAEEAAEEASRRASVHAAAEARHELEHRAALDALATAARDVRGLLDGLAAAVEHQATDLALALVTELVGQAVAIATPADVVARVLQVLPPAPVATVRLHPSVAAAAAAADLADRGLVVVADARLDRADALVETDSGAVTDLRIAEAMARVREVLS